MKLYYDPDADSLYIEMADRPATDSLIVAKVGDRKVAVVEFAG